MEFDLAREASLNPPHILSAIERDGVRRREPALGTLWTHGSVSAAGISLTAATLLWQ